MLVWTQNRILPTQRPLNNQRSSSRENRCSCVTASPSIWALPRMAPPSVTGVTSMRNSRPFEMQGCGAYASVAQRNGRSSSRGCVTSRCPSYSSPSSRQAVMVSSCADPSQRRGSTSRFSWQRSARSVRSAAYAHADRSQAIPLLFLTHVRVPHAAGGAVPGVPPR